VSVDSELILGYKGLESMAVSRLPAAALLCCAGIFGQPLREFAERRGVKIGTAVNPARLSEAAYGETLAREFNQAEPENAMKFGPIHPGASTYNFGPADAVVEFAIAHKMAVRGHTLVWHNQNPQWLTGGNLTPGQLAEAMLDHIRMVVGRYAGKVSAWDVVNEGFNDNGSLRSTIWYDKPGIGSTGTGYIERAFRCAREADPKARLFYNDYGAEPVNAKSDAVYAMVKDFKARGVPIDGVGLQMHLTLKPPAIESIEANVKRLVELGLEVQLTELDVRAPVDTAGVATDADMARQAQIYREVTALCLKFPKCTAIQTWGFTDKYSWIPRQFPGTGAALIFDATYAKKPAYAAMAAALR
jgi:endo-1,4-beta-xylanase